MGEMIRKQIYLEKRQAQAIRQKAKAAGTNESELIRQAINRELFGSGGVPTRPDPDAWGEIEAFLASHSAQPLAGEPYQFNREELYEERLERPNGTDSD